MLAVVVFEAFTAAAEDVLPTAVARAVSPASFRAGTLVVRVDSAVVGSEVRLLVERLLSATQRILKRRGFIEGPSEIRIRVAPSPRAD